MLVETSASAYSRKSEKFIETKKKIAREAVRLIPSHSVIFIDAGSTNYQLARQLIMRKDIIVVTNFTPIAELMNANEIKVILIGGEIRQVSGQPRECWRLTALTMYMRIWHFWEQADFLIPADPAWRIFRRRM